MCSCGISSVHNTLLDVESYICERPDSALCVLDSMDRNELTTKGLKAHHALLHAMALDKNFIDVSDDSLAQVAVDYYKNHGDRKYYARALYYLSVAYYYQQNYDEAIVELTKAEEIAEKHDSLYLGMLKIMQADTYRKTYNEVEQFDCLQTANHIFEEISDSFYVHVTEFQLARLYSDRFEYDKAEHLLKSLLHDENLSGSLRGSVLLCYAYIRLMQSDDNASEYVEIFEEVLAEYGENYIANQNFWVYAYALNLIGRTESADVIISRLKENDSSEYSFYWQYRIAKMNGNVSAALKYLEESNFKDNYIITTALDQSLAIAQRDFHESQSELAEYKAKTRMWTMLCIIIGALLLLTVILSVVTRYVRKLQEEKTANLQYAEELIRQLKISQEEDGKSLRNKYMELYRSQFEMLKVLCDEYFQSYERADAQRKIYKKVAVLIEEIREDSLKHDRFDHMIDDGFDGIMSNLRCEIPCLKELDYVIFSYFVIGFDATTISYLVDKSINTVYIRKSRIKDAIEELNPPHKDEFLEVLADSRLSEA